MAYDSFGNSLKRGYKAMPVAIRTIITLNVVMYVLQVLAATLNINLSNYLALDRDLLITITQPWRIITYMFLHSLGSPFHLIFNMLWL